MKSKPLLFFREALHWVEVRVYCSVECDCSKENIDVKTVFNDSPVFFTARLLKAGRFFAG
jgi:hypothetical protein